MTDKQLIAKWAKITDLKEAVDEFIKHSNFIGSDPYYRDLNDALWVMLERCSDAVPQKCDEGDHPAGSNGDKCFACFVYNEERNK